MRKLGAVMVLLMVILFGSSLSFGQDVIVDLDMGIDGVFKNNAYTDLKISINNPGNNINGKVKVGFNDYNNQVRFKVFYSRDVELPAGSDKEIIISVPVNFESFTSTFKKATIILEDNNGKELYRVVKKVNGFREEDELFFGIFTENKKSVNSFAIVHTGGRNQSITFADFSKDFPASQMSFKGFRGLFIDSFDTNLLTEENKSEIVEYLKSGGKLVLFLDRDYKNNISGVLDVLELKKEDITYDEELTINNKEYNSTNGIYSKNFGNGSIFIVGKSMESFRIQKDKNDLIEFITQGDSYSYDNNYRDDSNFLRYRLRETLTAIPVVNFPKTSRIFGILLLFSLTVGFINYFVLKKLDKRDFGWISIIAIILVFSTIITIWGGGNKFRKAVANNMSFITVENGVVKDWRGYMGIVNNTANKLKISGDKKFYPKNQIKNIEYDSPQDQYEIEIGYGKEENFIEYNFSHIWDQKIISYDYDGDVSIDINANYIYSDKGMVLKVKNGMDIDYKNVVIEKSGLYAFIGTIEANSEKEFNLDKLNYEDIYSVYDNNVSDDYKEFYNARLCSEFLRNYEMLNKSTGGGNILLGFTDENFISNVKINDNNDISSTYRNIIVSDVNYILPAEGKIVLPEGMTEVNVVNYSNSIDFDSYDGSFYVDDKGEIDFALLVRDDIDVENIQLKLVDFVDISFQIYDSETGEYKKVDNNFIIEGENINKYVENGLIKIKCEMRNNISMDRRDYPQFIVKGSVK